MPAKTTSLTPLPSTGCAVRTWWLCNLIQRDKIRDMAQNRESSAKAKSPTETPNFEQSLQRLEEIVHLLEDGDLGLSDALSRYEEGVKLLRQSYELLEKAERKIELLSGVDAEGNPITRPLADVSTLSLDEQKGG